MTTLPRITTPTSSIPRRRVLVLGATGTIGQATVRALTSAGNDVVSLVRSGSKRAPTLLGHSGTEVRQADITDPEAVLKSCRGDQPFDALLSCLASRTGAPQDAWAIDYTAHHHALAAAKATGIKHFILLSAICVQKPLLAFQKAKLAFEQELMASDLTYSIVRPTAFFKSLSGQVQRVKAGKPFLVFGDGTLTRCKPISDADLANFMVDCLIDPGRHNRIMPIGGPGPAITPLQQGEMLFALLGRQPRFKHVPVKLLDGIGAALRFAGHVVPALAVKAELARIGRYYATESMLVLDPTTGRYDAEATPSTGKDTLADFYARLLRGDATVDRGEHAVF